MKVLILGATGNLSRQTAVLLARGRPDIQLRLASHRKEGRDMLRSAHPEAEIIDADWYNLASLEEAFRGIDKALMVTPDFLTDERQATGNVIDAAHKAGRIQQLVRLIAMPPGFTFANLTPDELATRIGAALHTVAKPLLDASSLPVTYVNVACWIMFNLPWFMASSVKARRQVEMPLQADAPRQWVSETDVAEVFARILSNPAADHIGREYLLTDHGRYTFADVATLIGDVIGEKVTYIAEDQTLQSVMGENFSVLMTYFRHETLAYLDVPETQTIKHLLGRPQTTLRQYIEQNRALLV